MSLSSIGVVK